MKHAILLVLVALLVGGCGAAGKTGNTGGATGTRGELFGEENNIDEHTAAYRAGVTYCNLYPLEELARQEGVEVKAEAVARSYSTAEATPKDKKDAYEGCLAALKQK
jgi:hypothetical protein